MACKTEIPDLLPQLRHGESSCGGLGMNAALRALINGLSEILVRTVRRRNVESASVAMTLHLPLGESRPS